MHIAQVTLRYAPALGGVEYHVGNLANELNKQGHRITIYTSYFLDNIKEDTSLLPFEKSQNITVKRYKFLKLMHGRDSTYIQPRIFADLSKEKPDIIHVHGFRFFPVYGGIMFTYLSRIPVIATLHHDPQLDVTVLQRLHDRIFLSRLDRLSKIIALTEFERVFLTNMINKENITVIPNGISDMFIEMCDRFLNIRDQLRTNLKVFHKFVIISIGRVVPSKNIEIVLQALSALSYPLKDNIILVICGPTNDNYKAQLLQLTNDLKLQHNVVFYGQVTEEEKAMLLCSADLFVFPTSSEGFGIVILEALAAGLPVLASNIDTIESFMNQINQSTAAYLLDPKNHCEWATHIRLAYDDRETSNKARRLRKPISMFRWDALAKETLNIYETVKKPIV
jgi:glycosyltransferase involved in cell wall biosynthesis